MRKRSRRPRAGPSSFSRSRYYGRKGVDAPGKGDLWQEYQDWRGTEKAQAALRNGLIGSPETIRKRLRQFEEAHVDQVILLNQAGKTSIRTSATASSCSRPR